MAKIDRVQYHERHSFLIRLIRRNYVQSEFPAKSYRSGKASSPLRRIFCFWQGVTGMDRCHSTTYLLLLGSFKFVRPTRTPIRIMKDGAIDWSRIILVMLSSSQRSQFRYRRTTNHYLYCFTFLPQTALWFYLRLTACQAYSRSAL